MPCGDRERKSRRLPLAVINGRRTKCDSCEHNIDGICQEVKRLHPKSPAIIENGIRKPEYRCPLQPPKWGRYDSVKFAAHQPQGKTVADKTPSCVQCGRETEQGKLNIRGICVWCIRRDEPDRSKFPGMETRPITPRELIEPRRHLHYFLYPRFAESTRYHIEKLREYIWQFEGERVCCVATGSNTIHEKIRPELREIFTQVYEVPNDPKKRELVGFIPSLQRINESGATTGSDCICFAHGKGQQHGTSGNKIIREWTDAMYETVVGNWLQVETAMRQGYPLAGSFKVIGNFRTTRFRWHYSGSFFWARADSLFSKPWRKTCNRWWGSESYVGRYWAANEGFCLFGDLGRSRAAVCYEPQTWIDRLREELKDWRSMKDSFA